MLRNGAEIFMKLRSIGVLPRDFSAQSFLPPSRGEIYLLLRALLDRKVKSAELEKLLDFYKREGLKNFAPIAARIDKRYFSDLARFLENADESFGSFENFKANVSREWLLEQKGVGLKTADFILLFVCDRGEILPVSPEAVKLLNKLGYEFDDYEEIQSFLTSGDFDKVCSEIKVDREEIFAFFYAAISEFIKNKKYANMKLEN
ncbi:MAG: hypothetical protein LBU73_04310 [Helicobacteraceae bacterium]|jgi:endonuclease-3 related protein|nr:hypothetical protein [Helicobacteraceae bacterium]